MTEKVSQWLSLIRNVGHTRPLIKNAIGTLPSRVWPLMRRVFSVGVAKKTIPPFTRQVERD